MKKCLLIILFLLVSTFSYAEPLKMSDAIFSDDPAENNIIRRMDYWTRFFLARKILYVWGMDAGIIGGFDCSGSIETICRRSGLGHFPRRTSKQMWYTWANKNKWQKNKDMWTNAKFPFLIFYTFPVKPGKPPRPYGHVCFTWQKDDSKSITIAEASSSAGYFKETFMRKGDYHDSHWVGLMQLNLIPR